MRPLRVIQIIAGLDIGDDLGGAELFAVQLARHLPRAKFDTAVFALQRYGSAIERQWLERLAAEEIPVHGLFHSTGKLGVDLARVFPSLWSLVSEWQPDLINSHTERCNALNTVIRLLHPKRPRAVRTKHTDKRYHHWSRIDGLLPHAVYPLVFDAEVAVSETVRAMLDQRPLARLRRRRSTLSYNGIEADLLERNNVSHCATPPPGMPVPRPRMGIVGRLTEQKGHADLLHATRIVRDVHPVQLMVIGSGPLEMRLRDLAERLGIAESVHFLGSRQDVLDILPHLDLLVSSSLWEGFPTVLLEAMALNIPVVATDVSGSRELVNHGVTGFLAPPGRPDELARAITEALSNPARAGALAIEARRLASKYTLQAAAEQYAELYRQLIRSRM